MDMKLEVVVVPVADVERAKAFYECAGFAVDVDLENPDFRVVQLTPPGSACSIIIGRGFPQARPGSIEGLHLVVSDLEAARAALVERGIEVDLPFHFGPEGRAAGMHPDHDDYASYAMLSDPDENSWLLQEVGYSAADS
jgi:catechol 2,3-dioxygenase-like lactoylglutathione lyase family enzyme